MRFFAASILALVVTSAVAYTEVHLNIACKGIQHVSKLSLTEKVLVAHALQDSYNKVHSAAENDDSELSHVTVSGSSTTLESLGQGYPGWNGWWGCRFCPIDDDLQLGLQSAAMHKKWEAEFTEALMESGRDTFGKIGICKITMNANGDDEQEKVDSMLSDTADSAILIEAKCDSVHFGGLSLSALTFASHMLEDAYNKAHGNDDTELNGVHPANTHYSPDSLGQGYPGWNGWWGCRFCPNDDDMMMMSVSGAAAKVWEKEFATGLATSGKKAFKNVQKCSLTMKPTTDVNAEPNVDIDVNCKGGPDFRNLSVAQATLMSHALQNSYNSVHGSAADDDSDLEDVQYHGPSAVAELGQGYPGWNGWWGCRFCPIDDDSLGLSLAASGSALKAWEHELVIELIESENSAFQRVESCDIKMKQHYSAVDVISLKESEEEVSNAGDTQVQLSVKCDGITFETLSMGDDMFVGHALEDTYNQVHVDSDMQSDDSKLSGVRFGGYKAAANAVGQGYPGWNGWWGCRFCPNDDDALLGIGSAGFDLKLWEMKLAVALFESKRSAFQHVDKCDIKMIPIYSTIADE